MDLTGILDKWKARLIRARAGESLTDEEWDSMARDFGEAAAYVQGKADGRAEVLGVLRPMFNGPAAPPIEFAPGDTLL